MDEIEAYRYHGDHTAMTYDMLIILLQKVGIYANASSGQLTEILFFLKQSSSGYIWYHGRHIVIAHKKLSIISGEE